MKVTPTDYDAATDYEDAAPPEAVRELLPDDLKDAKIKGGETYPPRASIRLNGPPGAGKTTQIALRLAVLIEVCGVDPPNSITVATYRRSLADAVEQRLKEWGVIDEDTELEMWSTTHAISNRLTGLLEGEKRDYRKNSGRSMGPAVTGYEKYRFCAEVLDVKYDAGPPWEQCRGELLFDVLEYAHNNRLDPTVEADLYRVPAYEDLLEEWPDVDVPGIHESWVEWKDRKDLTEFHELLEAAVEPDAPLPPTEVVVIDEYHDAYPLMATVAERWISEADTAIIAGDPLQVVNAYSGADPRFFTDRLDHIPEVLLDKSWRVAEEHWQAAKRMLQAEFDAPPIDREGRGEIIEYRSPPFKHARGAGWQVPGANRPGSPGAIVDEHTEPFEDRDVLFLARMRKQCQGISKALDKAGVVHAAQDEEIGGWDEHRLNTLNAVIKLSGVPGNYGQETHGTGLLQYNQDPASIRLTAGEAAAILLHCHAGTLELSSTDRDTVVEQLLDQADQQGEELLSVDELDEHVKPEFWRRYTDGTATVRRLTKAGEFDDEDLEALQNAAVRYDDPVPEAQLRKVRVLTLHGAKGSEASDVVLYDGISSRTARDMEQSRSVRENEARTWYVALTRASERLHIMRDGFDWVQQPHLPRDIAERAAQAAQRVAEDERGESPV